MLIMKLYIIIENIFFIVQLCYLIVLLFVTYYQNAEISLLIIVKIL